MKGNHTGMGNMNKRKQSKYQEGDTVIAPNGYKYIYLTRDGKLQRILFHHHVAYKKYGRWPRQDERVVFIDGNRRNFAHYNIEFRLKGHSEERSLLQRQRTILNRIEELRAEYAEITEQLNEIRHDARALSSELVSSEIP